MSRETREVLRFDDLEPYLLLKNGNYLYKVPFRGGWAVLKLYYGSRSLARYVTTTLGNVLVCNQTSFMPKARLRTERKCLELWREAGFRVFETYDDVVVEGLREGGYALYEYVDAPRFVNYFADESVPLEERLATWRRFLPEWHRRHALALERREPMFVHENGDMKHVMIVEDGRFLFFDFEMCFRSRRRVREFVGREILAYLKSLGKVVGPELWPEFIRETLEHYPDPALLEYTYEFAFRNRNPVLQAARWIDRKTKSRARKPFSKYNVALRLHEMRTAERDRHGTRTPS
jgi:hypothetical protein